MEKLLNGTLEVNFRQGQEPDSTMVIIGLKGGLTKIALSVPQAKSLSQAIRIKFGTDDGN